MVDPERLREFNAHYARSLAEATALRGLTVVVFGVGAVGGFVASWLARHAVGLVVVDMDQISLVNLPRFVLTDPSLVGQFKATALAHQLRYELPALQSIRSIVADIRRLTHQQFDEIFSQASLVVASTGRTDLDRILDQWARFRGVPIVFPSLLAGHDTFLGDLHVVAWNLFAARRGSCFSCLRPQQQVEPPPAEAQQGAAIDVLRVAELTTDVALTLLTDSPKRRALVRGLEGGINYFVIPHWPPAPRRVRTTARTGCPVCQAAPTSTVAASGFTIATRDWVMGGSLVGTILGHQFIPGFDYAATILFVAVAGLWWRGRLATFDEVVARIRGILERR